jgi:hypothetical protein
MESNNKITDIKNIIKNENEYIDFWLHDPSILFNSKYIYDLWPKENMSRTQKFNAISRLIIFLTLLGLFISREYKILFTSLITLSCIIFLYYYLNKNDKFKENFSDENMYEKYKHNFTNPNQNNPMMNVMLPEIQDNPDRKEAAPSYNKSVEKLINKNIQDVVKKNFNDEKIDERLFNDLGDKIQFESSMRQFFTNPNTSIPNNQKDFAEFCYGNMASCKDGDINQCSKNLPRHINY